MKKKKLLTSVFILVLTVGVAGVMYYLLFSTPDQAGNSVADNTFGWQFPIATFPLTGLDGKQIAYSDIRDPGGIPQGLPVRLKIPIIGVDSAIEDALITPDGRMDVPQGSVNVAWFALGPHPGEVGSAVIGGHFGINNGVKFVFYDLDKLKVGDKIYVEDDRGNTLAFQVRLIKLFNRNADSATVFTSEDGKAHLNLITCEGIWNQVNDTYPERRVVFTDAIPTEGAAPAATVATAPSQSLTVGARGAGVVAFQTALVKKGFLTLPPGVAKGYFGALTRVAVAKYQTSVGLPSTGIYDASTRALLVPSLPATAITPTPTPTPTSPLALAPAATPSALAPSATPTPSAFVDSVKSLYATPMDGIITSLLIIAIVFIAFKIFRL